jgi:hypothetical protein
MATSGSVNFTMNRNEIIVDVLETINVKSPNQSAKAADINSCARKLNMMVKSWMKQGLHLWAMSEATLFLEVGAAEYTLGSTGDHCTNSYVHTTTSAAEALGSTAINLTSFAGMSASDNIGIVLDDGSIHWTTIVGAPGAVTTIASGLASAAESGAVVFAYTTKINRPLRVISAYRRDINNADIPVEIIARTDYADLSNKFTTGKAIQIYYNPQLTNGILSVWPAPDLATDVIRFWYERPLEDFDAATDNPDFPIEWAEAICAGLAYRMAKVYGLTATEVNSLKEDAILMLDAAVGFDKEDTSVFFQPDMRP